VLPLVLVMGTDDNNWLRMMDDAVASKCVYVDGKEYCSDLRRLWSDIGLVFD